VARTRSLMALFAVAGAGCVVVAVITGFAVRHAWIERKIAALTSPPTRLFSKENVALPPRGGRRRVVLIGDSSIARWPMERLSKRWQFVNRGVGGETVGQLAQRFDADALSLDPDAIVLSAGGNDLIAADFLDSAARRAVIDRTCETLKDLSRRAAERGIPVLIATLFDCRSGGNRFGIRSRRWISGFADTARSRAWALSISPPRSAPATDAPRTSSAQIRCI
jgi:lysophospholipase L1-like esterase